MRYLKMHEKLHKADPREKIRCNICRKAFSKRALANHVFKNHPAEFSDWRDNNMDLLQ
jgi:hypothetical protein